jgi:hypothetical protein
MMTHRSRPFLSSVLFTLAGLAVASGGTGALAAPPEADVKNAALFSLQCNATIGTIEDVSITGMTEGTAEIVLVRGTYRQKIMKATVFRIESLDTAGGVFEGQYDARQRKFTSLQFKVSLRSGTIPPNCLR